MNEKIDAIQVNLHYAASLVDTVAMAAQNAGDETISDGLMVLVKYLNWIGEQAIGLLDEEVPAGA